MGSVWCKADKGRSYSPKSPFSAISKWSGHVRQAYRKPKHQHRPPRPPQKPTRSNDRLTISAPTLVKEASSDGWRTATLIVPDTQTAPVPPPRKKRKRALELNRTAVSMDELNLGSSECLNRSTISLPDKCSSDILDFRSSSSTLVVTPILESRMSHSESKDEENKENMKNILEHKIVEEDEDEDIVDQSEIVPVEKETLFASRTLLHSNLGYVDKLSAISEVSAESGFDDKSDNVKYSDGSGSVTSVESVAKEAGMNILAHIHDITTVSQIKENLDPREKTAASKKEWLQNILELSDETGRDSADATMLKPVTDQPKSLPDHLNLLKQEMQTPSVEPSSLTSEVPPNPNRSVLLEIIQTNKATETESQTPNFPSHKEESIFLKNTKTQIVYKSLSSDNLMDDYENSYSDETPKLRDSVNKRHFTLEGDNQFNLACNTNLGDYSFHTPILVESDSGLNSLLKDKISNIVSSIAFKEIKDNKNYAAKFQSSNPTSKGYEPVVNGVPTSDRNGTGSEVNKHDKAPAEDASVISSSRKSSITDSLHEFEQSIYDMLKESKKNDNSSDEEDSLKTVK